MRVVLSVTTLLPLLAAASPMLVGTVDQDAAPILSSTNSREIPGRYMVIFKEHVSEDTAASHHSWIQNIHSEAESSKLELRKRSEIPLVDELYEGFKHSFSIAGSMMGYAGHFDDDVIDMIRRHPDVSTFPISLPPR
jgi:cerevisin